MQKLKREIIKANPSIMNLEFGCIIDFNDKERGDKEHFGKICEHGEKFGTGYLVWAGLNRYVSIRRWHITKIIGRLITLADVLITFAKNDIDLGDYTLEEDNITFTYGEGEEWVWCLFDNNLDNQTDETKQALKKLLVK